MQGLAGGYGGIDTENGQVHIPPTFGIVIPSVTERLGHLKEEAVKETGGGYRASDQFMHHCALVGREGATTVADTAGAITRFAAESGAHGVIGPEHLGPDGMENGLFAFGWRNLKGGLFIVGDVLWRAGVSALEAGMTELEHTGIDGIARRKR